MKCEVKLFCIGFGLHGAHLNQLQQKCLMMWPAGEAVPGKMLLGLSKE